MAHFLRRYRKYRQAGLSPIVAMRFAWMVGSAGDKPAPVRVPARR